MPHLEIIDAHKHNLKHLHLKLPKKQLIVVSGVSGSGKSTLAYDTIFQEGQRKYLESLSAYARQYIKSLERPDVQSIKGIAPTISIDQKHSSFYYNSTVGTVSEVAPFLRLLYAKLGQALCPRCGDPISRYSSEKIQQTLLARFDGTLARIYSPLVRNRKGNYQALFEKYRKRGFLKALVDGREYYLDDPPQLDRNSRHRIAVQVDAIEVESRRRGPPGRWRHPGPERGRRRDPGACQQRGGLLLRGAVLPALRHLASRAPARDLLAQFPRGGLPGLPGQRPIGRRGDLPVLRRQDFRAPPESLAFHFRGRTIHELGEMEIVDLLELFPGVRPEPGEKEVLRTLLPQVSSAGLVRHPEPGVYFPQPPHPLHLRRRAAACPPCLPAQLA